MHTGRKGELEVCHHRECMNYHYSILWEETSVIDRAIKEALHTRLTPKGQHLNGEVGLELPDSWVSTIKTLRIKPHEAWIKCILCVSVYP